MSRVNPIPFIIAAFAGLAFGWVVGFWTVVGIVSLSIVLRAIDA